LKDREKAAKLMRKKGLVKKPNAMTKQENLFIMFDSQVAAVKGVPEDKLPQKVETAVVEAPAIKV
jgi:hypothetical protein